MYFEVLLYYLIFPKYIDVFASLKSQDKLRANSFRILDFLTGRWEEEQRSVA